MSIKQTLQFLEHFTLGEAHHFGSGKCCYSAIDKESGDKYVAKVKTIPARKATTDALLLSGAFRDLDHLDAYFKDCARDLCRQAAILNALSHSDYFSHISVCQSVKRNDIGYDVWMLSPSRITLSSLFEKQTLPQEVALNLGIALCNGAMQARQMGFMHISLKPNNIYLSTKGTFQIGDIGFTPLSTLQYAPIPSGCNTQYFPPECRDCYEKISPNADVYSIGAILYQAFHNGRMPDKLTDSPANANNRISQIILTACSQMPEKRYQTPSDLLDAITDYKDSREKI